MLRSIQRNVLKPCSFGVPNAFHFCNLLKEPPTAGAAQCCRVSSGPRWRMNLVIGLLEKNEVLFVLFQKRRRGRCEPDVSAKVPNMCARADDVFTAQTYGKDSRTRSRG